VAAREAEAATHDVGNKTGPWELTPERYASVEAAQAASYLVRRNEYYPPLMMALYEAPWAATWATLPSSAPVSLPGVAARPAFAEQAGLIRELFGNPFRPDMLVDPVWLVSRGGIVPQLAQAAYQERRLPEGALDSARPAALADTLEDAAAPTPSCSATCAGLDRMCRGAGRWTWCWGRPEACLCRRPLPPPAVAEQPLAPMPKRVSEAGSGTASKSPRRCSCH
jgi:hypothetical protein